MNKSYVPAIGSPELKKIASRYRDLSMDEIRKRLKRRKIGRFFSLDQKVMIMKLLQLSGMDYMEISKETGVSRTTFYQWKMELGDTVFTSEPGARIAEKLETDLAILQTDTMRKAYGVINNTFNKMDELISKARSVRDIYPLAEALKACVEIIKIEKLNLPEQPKVNNYFMQIHEFMVNNLPHHKDN
jgi:hypothetical protein